MSRLDVADMVRLLEQLGYALLFFWVLAEEGALPIPSVPLLLAVGALVHTGHLNAVTAVACCLTGALVADIVWLYFGRIRGRRVLRFLCRISLESDSCISQTENSFLKRGLKTLLIAKFVPGLNAVAAPLAGDPGVGVARFLACDALGIVIWSGAYLAVGYLFSDQVEEALGYAQRLGSGILFLLMALFGAWILSKFIQRRRFLRRFEVARITPEELRDLLEAGKNPYIIDLRTTFDNDWPPVPGAILFSIEDLTIRWKEIPHDREIILCCTCPNEASSSRPVLLLKSHGITRARPLKGGAEAWAKMTRVRR